MAPSWSRQPIGGPADEPESRPIKVVQHPWLVFGLISKFRRLSIPGG